MIGVHREERHRARGHQLTRLPFPFAFPSVLIICILWAISISQFPLLASKLLGKKSPGQDDRAFFSLLVGPVLGFPRRPASPGGAGLSLRHNLDQRSPDTFDSWAPYCLSNFCMESLGSKVDLIKTKHTLTI